MLRSESNEEEEKGIQVTKDRWKYFSVAGFAQGLNHNFKILQS